MEIERLKLLVDRVRRTYRVNGTVNLEVVVIHDHHQIIQLLKACPHGSLPDLSLLDLSVTAKCIYTVIFLIKLSCRSHSHCHREPLSQRTARHIHARNMLHIRMSLQIGSCVAQRHQILLREKSTLCKRSVKSGCRVSFGQHKPVTIRHLRILRINVQLLKVQICENICRRERSARVSRFCTVHRFYNAFADFICCLEVPDSSCRVMVLSYI